MNHPTTGTLTRATTLIQRFIDDGEIGAAGLAVAAAGQLVLEWYGGDAAQGMPASPDVLWPICSITKLYTAATIMSLVEDGLLTLSTRVASVIPHFAGEGRDEIRLRHLLTHTSGLIDNVEDWDPFIQHGSFEDLLDHGLTLPLLHPPGSAFHYSDYGYGWAGRMAATVGGTSLGELLQARILDPLGLANTRLTMSVDERRRMARISNRTWPETPADWAVWTWENGAESAAASLPDLLRFGMIFSPSAQPTVLSRAAIRTMTTDQTGGQVSGRLWGHDTGGLSIPQPWGCGAHIRGRGFGNGDLFSPESFGHGGATGCWLQVEPADDIVIAFVSNTAHLNDDDRWNERVTIVLNSVMAELTR